MLEQCKGNKHVSLTKHNHDKHPHTLSILITAMFIHFYKNRKIRDVTSLVQVFKIVIKKHD